MYSCWAGVQSLAHREVRRLLEELNKRYDKVFGDNTEPNNAFRRSNVPLINQANASPQLNEPVYGASSSSFVGQGPYSAGGSSARAHSAQVSCFLMKVKH